MTTQHRSPAAMPDARRGLLYTHSVAKSPIPHSSPQISPRVPARPLLVSLHITHFAWSFAAERHDSPERHPRPLSVSLHIASFFTNTKIMSDHDLPGRHPRPLSESLHVVCLRHSQAFADTRPHDPPCRLSRPLSVFPRIEC